MHLIIIAELIAAPEVTTLYGMRLKLKRNVFLN